MKVFNVISTPARLAVTPLGNRLYEQASDVETITVVTDCGRLVFTSLKGIVTNFRSGGPLVDPFIDQIGDEAKSKLYKVHDIIYTPCAALGMEHPLSRKFGDELLHAGLLWARMDRIRAGLVYRSVRLFGGPAYDEDDALTSANSKLFTFSWQS